jgi:hypothetical protein
LKSSIEWNEARNRKKWLIPFPCLDYGRNGIVNDGSNSFHLFDKISYQDEWNRIFFTYLTQNILKNMVIVNFNMKFKLFTS